MSWEKRKLGELCSITKGKIGINKAVPGEFPLVVTSEERKSHNEFHFEGEAVIIPLVSSTGHGHRSLKRIHYQTGKFAVGSILCAVIPFDNSILNAEYLYRFLDLNREKELVSRMRGMANVTLPMKEIGNIEIPLPPLDEQRKFVEGYKKLEASNNTLSDEIANQLFIVKQLRQAFLNEAMQGKLVEQNPSDEPAKELLAKIKTEKEQLIKEKKIKKQKPLSSIAKEEIPFEIPKNWTWCRLGDVFQTTSGGTPSRGNNKFWNGTITWYKSGELNDSILDKDSDEKITDLGLKKSSANIFPKGTLLIAMYGATAGKLSILDVDAATNQAVCGFYNNEFVHTKYLFYYFMYSRKQIIEESWGMSQPNISQTYLKNFGFPLPPLSEQKRIVAKLDELMEYCDSLEESIKNSQTQNEMLLGQVLREALEPEEN